MVVVLKPLHERFRIKRIVVTTFQSVSGTGKGAMDELLEETQALLSFQEVSPKVYPAQIALTVFLILMTFCRTVTRRRR